MTGGDLLVFGTGGHARALLDVLQRAGASVMGAVGPGPSPEGVPLVRDDVAGAELARRSGAGCVLAVGDNASRLELAGRLVAAGARLQVVVARTATVARDARLGPGTVVLEHAHVGAAVRTGTAVVVNTGAVVEHNVVLGDGTHVAPGAVLSGAAICGSRVLVGVGAVLLPGVAVGDDAVVGAGAAVVRPVRPGTTVVGVPAQERP